jgi:tetratricopeptide (TPR) repeat protein
VLAVLAFVGISMVPLLGNVFSESQPTVGATPTASPSLTTAKKAELEEQARGYQLVVQREPDNSTALRGLLEARLQLGDIPGAIEPLERLAKLNPEQTDYGVLLAQAKQQAGDREGAATTYRTILSTKPGNLKALQGLVSLLLQEDRPEAAIGLLQDTLKAGTQINSVQPENNIDVTSVQLLLGQVYANEQRYTEAVTIYDESINSNKQDFRPVLAKAMVLQQQGREAEAKSLFTTAISLAPAQYKDQIKQLATQATASATTPGVSPDVSETPVGGS